MFVHVNMLSTLVIARKEAVSEPGNGYDYMILLSLHILAHFSIL